MLFINPTVTVIVMIIYKLELYSYYSYEYLYVYIYTIVYSYSCHKTLPVIWCYLHQAVSFQLAPGEPLRILRRPTARPFRFSMAPDGAIKQPGANSK